MDTTQDMTQIAAELNKLPKPTSFNSLYILAQQAFEDGFRSMTVNELVVYLSKNLPDELTRSEFIYEKFAPGSMLPDPGREASVILGPGNYNTPSGSLTLEENFNIVAWDGTEWLKILEVPIEVPEPDLSGLALKSEVAVKVSAIDVGIEKVPVTENILQSVAESDINDPNVWVDGYYSATGSLLPSVAYKSLKESVRAYPGVYNSLIYYSGNARVLAFNDKGGLIQAIPNPSSNPVTFGHEITLPEGTASIKISHLLSTTNVSNIKATPKTELTIPTNEVFSTPLYVTEKSTEIAEETLSKFGFEPIPLFTNFIDELTNSTLSDSEIWGNGMLRSDGSILQSPGWYHTKKKYRVYAGSYKLIDYFRGTGKVLLFNESEEIVQSLDGAGSPTVPFNGNINILQDGYIQLSYGSEESNLVGIGLWNNELIYPKDSTSTASVVTGSNESMPVNGKSITLFQRDIFKNTHIPKSKKAIATFISDDGNVANDEWYIPLLNDKGIFSTFAIITEFMINNPVTMKPDRVKELHELGHDIAGHTHTHLPMATLTLEEVEFQLSRCKTELLAMDINAETFVAPFSSRTDDVSRLIRKYYKTDWKAVTPDMILDGTCCNTPPIESFLLKRIAFDAQVNGVSTLADAKAAVDVAFAKNEWVAFAIHPQYPEYSPTGNPNGYLARRQDVSDLIDYILLKNIQILTVKQALDIWRNPVEIGNVRLDLKYYALGMDGTETGNYFD